MRKSGSSYNNSEGLKKGAWTADEDQIVKDYVKSHGVGKWGKLSRETGLKRCGKSVRLRWLNYLRPEIVRGNITKDEEDLIIRLHKLLGNRWSLIAGRIPGRTDNEIKNYWHSCLRKKKVHQENHSQVMPRKEFHICREIMSSSAAVAAAAVEGNPHLTGSNVDNGDEYHHRRKPDDCNGSGDDDLWWNSFIMNLNDVQLDVSEFQSNNFPEIWESEMDVFDAARHYSTDNIYIIGSEGIPSPNYLIPRSIN